MGGRGGSGGGFARVLDSSKNTIQISGSVYFDDGIHVPTTHKQREIPLLLSGLDDAVIQVNNDARGKKQIKSILDQGFFVVRSHIQNVDIPYLRNYYYIRRKKK